MRLKTNRKKRRRIVLLLASLVGVVCLLPMLFGQTGGKDVPHRRVRTALEAYFVDYNAYPPWEYKQYYGKLQVPTFKSTQLTTPTPYLPSMPTDVFSRDENHWYSYYSVNAAEKGGKSGWVLISPGPDQDYDFDPTKEYDPASTTTLLRVRLNHYDATNGTISNGDLISICR